jgi:adenylylsulfate kinase-like enzyme
VVIWIIGISASGKSTLAGHLINRLRTMSTPWVLLDGDEIREIFGNDVDYTISGRAINATRLSKLSKLLDDSGVSVVAPVLSIFPEWQNWNRKNIKNYKEIFMKVDIETAKRRETKGIYERASKGLMNNVVGLDIPFPSPPCPDMIICNDVDLVNFDHLVNRIIVEFEIRCK